jgi:hypothetical protein
MSVIAAVDMGASVSFRDFSMPKTTARHADSKQLGCDGVASHALPRSFHLHSIARPHASMRQGGAFLVNAHELSHAR